MTLQTDDTPVAGEPGSAAAPDAVAGARKVRARDARQARFAQTFAQVVAVLMRDANFRRLRIADLEWLVLPPIMAGQWRLGQAAAPSGAATAASAPSAPSGPVATVPMAVALWASVSDAIDQRLSSRLDKPLLLKPDEWASGPNLWMIAAGGDARYMPAFLRGLHEKEFPGKRVKLRHTGPDGTARVATLAEYIDQMQAGGPAAVSRSARPTS